MWSQFDQVTRRGDCRCIRVKIRIVFYILNQPIEATIAPTKTDYLFYLSDSKGNMHYAVTHDGHVANKDKYIP